MPKPQAPQQLADTPLVQVQPERFGNLRLQINPPPAHHPVLSQHRPARTQAATCSCCAGDRRSRTPPAWGRSDRPATPSALNRCQQEQWVAGRLALRVQLGQPATTHDPTTHRCSSDHLPRQPHIPLPPAGTAGGSGGIDVQVDKSTCTAALRVLSGFVLWPREDVRMAWINTQQPIVLSLSLCL